MSKSGRTRELCFPVTGRNRSRRIDIRLMVLLAGAFGGIFNTSPAFAWDGAEVGTVGLVEVTAAQNYGFRVWLENPRAMCTGGPNFAYLNESDSNYKVYVAAILAAKAQASTVTIFTWGDGGGNCKIAHLSIS